MSISRRGFIQSSVVALAAAGSLPRLSAAKGAAIPIGLELYWVGPALRKDLQGTLDQVAKIGYQQVEFGSFLDKQPAELRAALASSGLKCDSGLFVITASDADTTKYVSFAHDLGLKYMVCAVFPMAPYDPSVPGSRDTSAKKLALDDFKRAAELFNRVGEQSKRAGIQFRFHNHNMEFRKFGDTLGYDELLRLTDPELVSMEMDCGWVFESGHDPVHYLRHYPKRFSAVRIRDRRKPDGLNSTMKTDTVEIGRGVIDWKRILPAAHTAGVKIGYVEVDPSPTGSPEDSVALTKGSYDYLDALA